MTRPYIAINQDWFGDQGIRSAPHAPEPAETFENDNGWLGQFVVSPSDIPFDDDHDDVECEIDEMRPSLLLSIIAAILVGCAIFAMILPGAGA